MPPDRPVVHAVSGEAYGLDREVPEHVLHRTSLDVLTIDLRQRLAGVTRTEGTLVVRELDQGDLRRGLPLEDLVRQAARELCLRYN